MTPELKLPAEPTIMINGTQLNSAQAMTVRVAVGTLNEVLGARALNMSPATKDGYQERINEIWKMMGLL